jgi:hypothetical protein
LKQQAIYLKDIHESDVNLMRMTGAASRVHLGLFCGVPGGAQVLAQRVEPGHVRRGDLEIKDLAILLILSGRLDLDDDKSVLQPPPDHDLGRALGIPPGDLEECGMVEFVFAGQRTVGLELYPPVRPGCFTRTLSMDSGAGC